VGISSCSTSVPGVPLFDDLHPFRGSTPLLSKSEECEEAVESGFDDATETEEEQENDTSDDADDNSGNCPRAQAAAVVGRGN